MELSAYHILRTNLAKSPETNEFSMNFAEMFTMIVSALLWKELNGKITLITDERGFRFVQKQELTNVWDQITIEKDFENIMFDEQTYWAAGKIIALRNLELPAIILDLDLIITRSLSDVLINISLAALHPETLNENVYPPIKKIGKITGRMRDFEVTENILPANTAFMYISDKEFRNLYTTTAIELINNMVLTTKSRITPMVFVEQRIFADCAYKKGMTPFYLLNHPFDRKNDIAIHLWGFKKQLRENISVSQLYLRNLHRTFGKELNKYPVYATLSRNI
jgi:hypothetical protein